MQAVSEQEVNWKMANKFQFTLVDGAMYAIVEVLLWMEFLQPVWLSAEDLKTLSLTCIHQKLVNRPGLSTPWEHWSILTIQKDDKGRSSFIYNPIEYGFDKCLVDVVKVPVSMAHEETTVRSIETDAESEDATKRCESPVRWYLPLNSCKTWDHSAGKSSSNRKAPTDPQPKISTIELKQYADLQRRLEESQSAGKQYRLKQTDADLASSWFWIRHYWAQPESVEAHLGQQCKLLTLP